MSRNQGARCKSGGSGSSSVSHRCQCIEPDTARHCDADRCCEQARRVSAKHVDPCRCRALARRDTPLGRINIPGHVHEHVQPWRDAEERDRVRASRRHNTVGGAFAAASVSFSGAWDAEARCHTAPDAAARAPGWFPRELPPMRHQGSACLGALPRGTGRGAEKSGKTFAEGTDGRTHRCGPSREILAKSARARGA